MEGETFASYILNESEWTKKLEIVYYLKKKTGIFYDNTVIFKTLIAKQFLDYLVEFHPQIKLDENLIITARLLCDCLKKENSTDLEDIRNYAREGALYLSKLGFDNKFCKICESVNRYTIQENRTDESDILELSDQFGGMLLDRPERIGFKPDEALVLLQFRNLKDKYNKYLDIFIEFVNYMNKNELLEWEARQYDGVDTRIAINSSTSIYERTLEVLQNYKEKLAEKDQEQVKDFTEDMLGEIKKSVDGRETIGNIPEQKNTVYIKQEDINVSSN